MSTAAAYDVVVMGAGLAGLAAANRAAELGLKVLVLEQGVEEIYLCNSRITGGFFHVARENMRDAPAELRRRIDAATSGYAEPALADALAQDSLRTLEWMAKQGVRFIKAGPTGQIKNALAPPSVRKPGANNWHGRAGDVMLRTLGERLLQQGGALLRGVRATGLVMQAGVCRGVQATQGGAVRQFPCAAVVIADGGFQADAERVRKHISPAPDRVMRRNAGTGLGDGARMAEAAGAKLTGMNRFYGHLLYQGAMESERFWPYPTLDFLASGAIVVDGRGRRFVDEGYGGTHISNEIAALEDPLSAVVIYDGPIWEGPGRDHELPPNPFVIDGGGTMVKAPTLALLAEKLGMPAPALEATVAEYNDTLARGEAAKLSPPRSAHQFKPWPIATPPYYAMRVCAGLTYTMGGIATDANGRVLKEDGSPIPGLFAAGSSTGGLEGGEFSGYTGGLSKAAVFGLRAGECIAQSIKGGGARCPVELIRGAQMKETESMSNFRKPIRWLAVAMVAAVVPSTLIPSAANAQAWPAKPIKIVVSFEPRGGNDFIARLMAVQLTPVLGQSIVVENRTGAGGNIGVEYVSKQPADGHTILVTSAAYIINANLFEKLPFDPINDFDAVSLIVRSSWVLTVPAASPAKSVKELIALAKSSTKGLAYGSAGIGTTLHFASEMVGAATGAKFLHVPYKGSGPVVPGLLAGDIDFAMTGSAGVMSHIKTGKLRALAVMSSQRTSALPGVPTVAEALAMPGLALDGWTGAVVPDGTPRAVIGRLSTEISKAIRDPVLVKEKLAPSAYDAVGSTPEEFAETIRSDAEKYARIAKLANIKRQ